MQVTVKTEVNLADIVKLIPNELLHQEAQRRLNDLEDPAYADDSADREHTATITGEAEVDEREIMERCGSEDIAEVCRKRIDKGSIEYWEVVDIEEIERRLTDDEFKTNKARREYMCWLLDIQDSNQSDKECILKELEALLW